MKLNKIHSQNRREKKRKTLRMKTKKIINFRLEMTLTAWNYIKRSQTTEENENEGKEQTN